MRHIPRILIWFFVIAIAIWSVVYFFQHYSSGNFQESAMGNLFSTILGVMVGIPIALEINRHQQNAQQLASNIERQEEDGKRKQKVLTLLKTELEQNREDVQDKRKPLESGGKREVHTHSLRDEMWAAFSDGGELQYVNNPEVLAAISNAYYEIRASIHLERSFMSVSHFPGIQAAQDNPPKDRFLGYLTLVDPRVLDAIEKAIARIDNELAMVAVAL